MRDACYSLLVDCCVLLDFLSCRLRLVVSWLLRTLWCLMLVVLCLLFVACRLLFDARRLLFVVCCLMFVDRCSLLLLLVLLTACVDVVSCYLPFIVCCLLLDA